MRSLTEFIEEGTLPFIGRADEMDRLVGFCRTTANAHGLRVGLLLGEAGIGKSRMLEELLPAVQHDGAIVLHVKLTPPGTPLIPPIARTLRNSVAAQSLLKSEIEDSLSSVIPALQRLARLRPTLLVVEDLHLLPKESLGELAVLLDGMATELFSVLCVARPVALAARGMIERYLVDEIELVGLRRWEVEELRRELLGASSVPDEILYEETLGNPLALRTALRRLIKEGSLLPDPVAEEWRMTVSPEGVRECLRRSVGMLAEGMTALLTPSERDAAERLACLGDVFAVEGARAVIEGADEVLDTLSAKGFIVSTGMLNPPLPGPMSSHQLLAFTSTLLHRHFVRSSNCDASLLVTIIAVDTPLYTILPFRLLGERPVADPIPSDLVRVAVERALNVADVLDQSPDWEQAPIVWKGAESLFRSREAEWDGDDRCYLSTQLIDRKLTLLRRESRIDELETWVERYLELTANVDSERCAMQRVKALNHLFTLLCKRDGVVSREVWEEFEKLVQGYPKMYLTERYIDALQNIAGLACSVQDHSLTDTIEHHLRFILGAYEAPERLREYAKRKIGPFLLTRFSTAEELQGRLRLLAELNDLIHDDNDVSFPTWKFMLLAETGRVDELLKLVAERIPYAKARGLMPAVAEWRILALIHGTAFGGSLQEAEREIGSILDRENGGRLPSSVAALGAALCTAVLLRGEAGFAREIIPRYFRNEGEVPYEIRVAAGLNVGDPDQIGTAWDASMAGTQLRLLTAPLFDPATTEIPRGLIEQITTRPVLRTRDLLAIHTALDVAAAVAAKTGSIPSWFQEELRKGMLHGLEWLADRSLFAYMSALLDRGGKYLTRNGLNGWNARIQGMTRRRLSRENPSDRNFRLEVSMLGAITVRKYGEEPATLRGSRLRLLLGLMVADRMLENPLSHREFCRLASSGESDPEYARKVMNGAVWRLRDVLGHEAISTEAETPRLDPEVVSVDLLEAHRLLNEIGGVLLQGTIMHAPPLLLKVLEISRGAPSFPSLHDSFFEAARVDFDCRLRSTVIEVARRLLGEGDLVRAEEVLRKGHESLGGDPEIADLLCKALMMLDKRTEAERVRMRETHETS